MPRVLHPGISGSIGAESPLGHMCVRAFGRLADFERFKIEEPTVWGHVTECGQFRRRDNIGPAGSGGDNSEDLRGGRLEKRLGRKTRNTCRQPSRGIDHMRSHDFARSVPRPDRSGSPGLPGGHTWGLRGFGTDGLRNALCRVQPKPARSRKRTTRRQVERVYRFCPGALGQTHRRWPSGSRWPKGPSGRKDSGAIRNREGGS